MITRRFVLGGLLAGVSLPALAEVMESSPRPKPRKGSETTTSAAAPEDFSALVDQAKLGGSVSFVVADAATGTVLASYEPDISLPPASVAKAVTALYALEKLGPGYRFATRVLATGSVTGGMVQGDLILAGGGDPTLQTDKLGDLVAKLADAGIKGATGRFLYWDGALPRLKEIADDQPVHVGYNAAICGLNLNFNRVHFEWKRSGDGWAVAVDARGERFQPKVEMVNVSVASRESPLFTHKDGQVEEWTVASSALGKDGSRWLPVRDPGRYVAEVFRTLAKAQGITLSEAERMAAQPSGGELVRVESAPLPEVLRAMLRFSTNITAECVGLAASGAADLAASAKAMDAWVKQTFNVDIQLFDHSGLGGASRVTAAAMARILVSAEQQGRGLRPILRDVGMKNDEGEVVEGHPVKVLAKSGTLNFVSGLAGYVVPPTGQGLVFAIFSGDPARRDAVPIAEREGPNGSKSWAGRARRLQGQLINRWAESFA